MTIWRVRVKVMRVTSEKRKALNLVAKTPCKNGWHFNILLSAFKLASLASFLSSNIIRIFSLERG